MLEALFLLSVAAGGDDEAAKQALDRFRTAYANPSAPARATAVTELSRTPHDKTLARLAPLVTGEEVPVRIAAARGMASFAEYKGKAIPILISSIEGPNAKEPDVQAAIFESLGKLGDETTLPTVHRYFGDKDAKVASAALAAAGEIKKSQSIDPIIALMTKMEKYNNQSNTGGGGGVGGVNIPGGGTDPNRQLARALIPACMKALQAITGEKWSTSKEWTIWWSRQRNKFGQGEK